MPNNKLLAPARIAALAILSLVVVIQPAQIAAPPGAAAQTPLLDDLLCYTVALTKGSICVAGAPLAAGDICTSDQDCGGADLCVPNKPPVGLRVALRDRFEDMLFSVTRPVSLCNPGAEDLGSIAAPDALFESYLIKTARTVPPQPKHTSRTGLRVSDRFGRLLLTTLKPDRLLVPSAESLAAPVAEPTPSVDHFKCYRVKALRKVCEDDPSVRCKTDVQCADMGLTGPCSKGLARGVYAAVANAFSAQPRLYQLTRPTRLCNPVDKQGEGILDPSARRMCYLLRPAPLLCSQSAPQNAGLACRSESDCGGIKRVSDFCVTQEAFVRVGGIYLNNQFGPGVVDAVKETELCVPAVESAPASCGNGVAEQGEVCDGSDLAGEDCVSQGFVQGALACLAGCGGFDISGCSNAVCGDNTAEAPELCDGSDLAGEDCVSRGFVQGALACVAECSGFDTSACVALPPDPALVATPVDPTVATAIGDATAFLYEGTDPVQRDVAPDTIDPRRAAIVRGRVLARDGSAVAAASVSIAAHPEYGSTLTRADGHWDMAVNGGGDLVVRFEKTGYLPAQRQVYVPWLDYVGLADVVLIELDPAVNVIDLETAAAMQVARGSQVTDDDGTRQATLLIPQGTGAELVFANGTTQPITTLSIRATEYTVGPGGPAAMPGVLPPTSGYTYAVELSADEALAAGAASVVFDQTLYVYLENFLGLPTAAQVPAAWYDRDQAAWVPYDDGVVIEIVSISGGLADIDSDGDGLADDAARLAALSMTDAERERLAALYAAGQSLWRIGVNHFSSHDFNLGVRPYPGAESPGNDERRPPQHQEDSSVQNGWGSIDIENQILREELGIPGSRLRLHYASDRTAGRTDRSSLEIQLSGDTVPAPLTAIRLEVSVAGQSFVQEFPPLAGQSYTFEWDGKDAYGRTVHGSVPARVKIGYLYPAYYTRAPQGVRSFAISSGMVVPGDIPARDRFALWQEYTATMQTSASWFAEQQGVGGWTFDAHHAYDPLAGVIHFGDGTQRRASSVNLVAELVAGNGEQGYGADGIPAVESPLYFGGSAVVGADGSVYYDDSSARIRRVRPDGIVVTVAGNGSWGNSGDGGPATDAEMRDVGDLAVGPDGSLYFSDYYDCVVRRVWPNGIIDRIAGTGLCGYTGDVGPATSVQLFEIYKIAVGDDGAIYFNERNSYQIRKISTDGLISRVVGTGVRGYSGDGGPALDAQLDASQPRFALGPDGSLYIYDLYRIRRVTPDGIISVFAGTGVMGPPEGGGDGGPALEATFRGVRDIEVDVRGNVFVLATNVLRLISSDGIIRRVAGSTDSPRWICEGQAATDIQFHWAFALGLGPDGSVVTQGYRRICRVRPAIAELGDHEIAIPSQDAGVLYVFDADGRHLRTVNALTSAVLLSFAYDAAGRLASVTDAAGNSTTVERDGAGRPTALVAPYGQRTELTLDGGGHLASATSPSADTVEYVYDAGGLLTSMTTPNGHVYAFTYDTAGRLTHAADPEGGSSNLARTALADGYEVVLTSAEGESNTHRTETLASGERRRVLVGSDGLQSVTLIATGGKHSTTMPDGTVVTVTPAPDPRFGMQAPLIAERKSVSPGGLTYTLTNTRTATLADRYDLLSLTALTQTTTVNGRVFTTSYDATTRAFTHTTAGGRQTTTHIDELGRVVEQARSGIEAITHAYDLRGRRSSTTQGSGTEQRTVLFDYDASGYLATVTDPLGREITAERDATGRVLRKLVAGTALAEFAYDANGNLTRTTPPGRPAHVFAYNGVDAPLSYTPPDVGAGSNATLFDYDLDRHLVAALRPDGVSVGASYDAAGRPALFDSDAADVTLNYNHATGRGSSLVTEDGVTTSYTFDSALVRQVQWQGPVAGIVGFTYDNDLRLVSLTVNGQGETRSYNTDGWLTGVGAMTITRDASNGLLLGSTLGALTDSVDYNGFAEVVGYSAAYAGIDVFAVGTTRDHLSRITRRVETVGGVTDTYDYAYDALGRLATVEKNTAPYASYGYDTNGNRLSYDGPDGAWTAVYDAQDRLLERGTTTYTYGANGELATRTDGAEVTVYDYDADGNLRSVALPDGSLVEYVIDGAGRRIAKKLDGVPLQSFLYANTLSPVAELDGAGALVSRFVYATRAGVPDFMVRGGATYRIVSDSAGSPRLVIAVADGSVAQRIDYDEFGNVLADTNPGFQPFGFGGGLYDGHTGLLRFGARDYDPKAGRWTAKDPIGFAGGSSNLYSFVGNQPLTRRDPSGLFGFTIGGELAAMFADVMAVAGSVGTGFYFGTKNDLSLTVGHYRTASIRAGGGAGGGIQPGIVVGVSPFGTYENFIGESVDLNFDVDVLGGASLNISTPEIAPDAGNLEKLKNVLRSHVSVGVGLGPSVGAAVTVGGSTTGVTQYDSPTVYAESVQNEMNNPDPWGGEF